MVDLGDRVKDKISGLKGVVVARCEWLYGCTRLTIQPEDVKNGKPVDTYCLDEPQLEIIKKKVIDQSEYTNGKSKNNRTHGGRDDSIAMRRN